MRWYITVEKGKEVIRGGERNKRLAREKYSAFQDDPEAMRSYVVRLNAVIDLRKKVEIKHAFINDAMLDEYFKFLKGKIPQESGAKAEFAYLKHYGLAFFANHLGLVNPADWFKVSDTKWAAFLLGEGSLVIGGKPRKAPKSAKSKRDIVNAMNRFIVWYHRQRPDECPLVVFDPISRAKYASVEGKREMEGAAKIRKYIPEEHMKAIEAALPDDARGPLMLLIRYGLRRSEACGFKPDDLKHGHLDVCRQMKKINTYSILKGKDARKTPHWYATRGETYGWIQSIVPMNPRTLAAKWDEVMIALKFRKETRDPGDLNYTLHDVRHTWITNAIRGRDPRDVQLAVGHKDLRITQEYLKDDRGLSDQVWKPTG